MQARAFEETSTAQWDRQYEFKAVGLIALGMGLVGLDRFIISPLFPVMQKDLGLSYQDFGLISAVLALTWGVAAILSGRLSDRIGHKRVMVPAMIVFSLLVGCSGFATGLLSLLLIRGAMGLAEGAYAPASIVATIEASKPTRIGLNVGLQQMMQPFFGLGLGPVIAVALLAVVPSWHWVFAVVAIPGLILALVMAKVLRERVQTVQAVQTAGRPEVPSRWRDVFRYRAVTVNGVLMICHLTCLITLAAFLPNYLTDHLKLDLATMALVLAAQGVGSCVGTVVVPAISDRLGRKSVLIVALAIEVAALLALREIGAQPVLLFSVLFVVTFMGSGAVAVTVGPLTSAAVPAAMATSATGIVVGLGEIVGGAIAPAVSGALAHRLGIDVIPTICLVAAIAGLAVAIVGVRKPIAHLQEKRA